MRIGTSAEPGDAEQHAPPSRRPTRVRDRSKANGLVVCQQQYSEDTGDAEVKL